jgi:arylsulfatase A-like enzyme/Tfp pilus assembly protein PilF
MVGLVFGGGNDADSELSILRFRSMRLCKHLLWLMMLLMICQLPALSARGQAAPIHPNIVLITLDTVRADRVGFLGSARGLTPKLDRLARQSIAFTHTYSQVPLTTASHATILTGTYPQFHRVNDFGVPLSPDLPYVPEILRRIGYRTGAFIGSLVLDPIEGTAPGFDRGFEIYDAGFHTFRPGQDRYRTLERRADEVVERAISWLNKPSSRPFFLWVHLYDAHDPYNPPEPYNRRFASEPYDGEIAYVDAAVGKLLERLRTSGLYNGALIAVMSDHGEGLGGHGEQQHGVFLYDETIHVPLLFKLPLERFSGKRIDARVGLVDVAPTLLQIAGLNLPKAMQGESLVPLWTRVGGDSAGAVQHSSADRAIYAETDYPHKAFGWSSVKALRTGKYLYIQAPREELYDLDSDPSSTKNLVSSAPAVADTLKSKLELFRRTTVGGMRSRQATVDLQQQEKLNALGYVSFQDSVRSGIKESGADPKDKIELVNLLHEGIIAVEEGRYQAAIPLLEHVLAEEPYTPVAYVQLGTAWSWLKNYEAALPVLHKAVEFTPESALAHYELALALFQTGDLKASALEFETAVSKAPRWAALHFSLATVYARLDRTREAIQQLQTAIQLRPDDFRANLMLGRMLTTEGEPSNALPLLRKAVKLQPTSPEAHTFLADVYSELGQETKASLERIQAERLNHSQ